MKTNSVHLLLICKGQEVLLVKPKDEDYYLLPGGKIEAGETFKKCLHRELKEEVPDLPLENLNIKRLGFVKGKTPSSGKDVRLFTFFALVDEKPIEATKVGAEIEEAFWTNNPEIENITQLTRDTIKLACMKGLLKKPDH